jgi:polysaccharide biosynthesis transport protein
MTSDPHNSPYAKDGGRPKNGGFPNSAQKQSMPSNEDDTLIDLRGMFLLLWRRKFIILSIVLIGLSVTLILLTIIKPVYTARAIVLVEASSKSRAADELKLLVNEYVRFDTSFITNEIEVMRSRSLIRKVIEKLDLLSDPEFNLNYRTSLQKYAPELLNRQTAYKSLNVYKSALENLPVDVIDQQMNALITIFINNMTIKAIPGSYAIQIQYSSLNPSKAALIANTIAEVYIEERLEAKFKASKKVTDWLDSRLGELRNQVREAEMAVAEYRAKNNLNEGVRTYVSAEQLSQLNSQLIDAKAQRAAAEARLSQIRRLAQSGSQVDTSSDVMNSAFVLKLKSDEANLIRQLSDLSKRYGDKHPKMQTLKAEMAELRRNLSLETQNIIQNVANEVQVAEARVSSLESDLEQIKGVRDIENEKLIRLNELQREADSNRMIFDNFLETYKRSDEQEQLQEANARILSFAAIPNRPAFPQRMLFLSLGLAISLFFGLFLALLLEKLDNKFRSSAQLEKSTGYPCFALIPKVSNIPQSHLAQFVLDKPSSTVAEAMRTLRTVVNLRGRHDGKKPKVITVTSSFPGEGKTTISTWLARLAAKSGDRVILIDADLRRPNVHRLLGQPNDITLVDYLTGKSKLKDVIQKDSASGLHMVYAKSVPNSALALITSATMANLIEALREEYDLVVIDSPACLAVSDARQLATYSDQLIYAVAWDKTPREIVLGGVKQFSDIGYHRIGLTLTNVDVKRHVRYGYGDTVYYYGRYTEDEA